MSSQVSMMKQNRGVRIDEEQFKEFDVKVESLRGEVENANSRKVVLETENVKQR